MATFSENIRKIRGEATYGPDMRTAIADAITQSVHLTYTDLSYPYPDTREVYVRLTPTTAGSSDYVLGISKTTS